MSRRNFLWFNFSQVSLIIKHIPYDKCKLSVLQNKSKDKILLKNSIIAHDAQLRLRNTRGHCLYQKLYCSTELMHHIWKLIRKDGQSANNMSDWVEVEGVDALTNRGSHNFISDTGNFILKMCGKLVTFLWRLELSRNCSMWIDQPINGISKHFWVIQVSSNGLKKVM